jgi:probable rRNA maturation factor
MKLLFVNQSRDTSPEKWLKKWTSALARAIGKKAKLSGRELVVVFVSSSEMKRLNHLYRGKDYATDVLSFESADPDSLGELVICPPVIRSQSKRTGLSERGELGYMIVHGVLHLLGYDHGDAQAEAEMFALQDKIFRQLEKSVGLR